MDQWSAPSPAVAPPPSQQLQADLQLQMASNANPRLELALGPQEMPVRHHICGHAFLHRNLSSVFYPIFASRFQCGGRNDHLLDRRGFNNHPFDWFYSQLLSAPSRAVPARGCTLDSAEVPSVVYYRVDADLNGNLGMLSHQQCCPTCPT